jgi:putative chitinase
MAITADQIKAILNITDDVATKWEQPLNVAMTKYEITTTDRTAAFIAQIGYESGGLSRTEENLNYSAEGLVLTFPKYFTTSQAQIYARQPEKIANKAYANRLGNGDEASGDGWTYRGRGPIQLTGKFNYNAFSQAIGVDFITHPESIEDPYYGALSAGWFWNGAGLNTYADIASPEAFDEITKKINGGLAGKADRDALYGAAKIILGS